MLGLSGGVDSSVAALLLQQAHYPLQAVFMKNWEEDDSEGHCTAEDDLADARQVAETLGIELQGVNFSDQYWDRVFEYFLTEYRAGRTPNPDILCNKEIKFKAFLDYALKQGADKIATGHYARIEEKDGQFFLMRARDHNKDQTYFLYALNQYQLGHALFPIGELEKSRVRELAKQHELITFNKKDSTGICFIGERDFKAFLQKYLPAQPGEMRVLDTEAIIGRHDGLMYYTLGQRQGLGIGGVKDYADEPWYVAGKDLENNILYVVQGKDHPALYQRHVTFTEMNWINERPTSFPFACTARTRYRQPDSPCQVVELTEQHGKVVFDQPQWAVTPGQSVVFYQDEVCLGGGIIQTAE
jgi:tRNA-specific 2-thiouridylase